MRWCISFLAVILLWAHSASGFSALNENIPNMVISHHTAQANDWFNHHAFSEKIENRSAYKQIKYSKKLSRYLWLKDKKPKVLSYYNNLSRIVFFHSLPPVNFFNKELFHVSSVEHDHSGNLRVIIQQIWTQNPPDSANRLGGWKESNVLYKGSLTYHSIPTSVI